VELAGFEPATSLPPLVVIAARCHSGFDPRGSLRLDHAIDSALLAKYLPSPMLAATWPVLDGLANREDPPTGLAFARG
jgi:hypothetical protein